MSLLELYPQKPFVDAPQLWVTAFRVAEFKSPDQGVLLKQSSRWERLSPCAQWPRFALYCGHCISYNPPTVNPKSFCEGLVLTAVYGIAPFLIWVVERSI